jgi:DNA invertase Pin-like site-specific DNA recombinase
MNRAVYYARVSTETQREEGTIASQQYELIQQIKRNKHLLVKAYEDGAPGVSEGKCTVSPITPGGSQANTAIFLQ